MKCLECVNTGVKSTVFELGTTTTTMHYMAFYDEDGSYHHHDSNIRMKGYRCSNGHCWSERLMNPCPNPECKWTTVI